MWRLRSALPVASIVCGLALSVAWGAFLGFELFEAVRLLL